MKVCVVGQGPSAAGCGGEIDACDFVVRLRSYWTAGAEDAGSKISAHAYFGWWGGEEDPTGPDCEQWFTHCPQQLINHLCDDVTKALHGKPEPSQCGLALRRLGFFVKTAGHRRVFVLGDDLWHQMRDYLGSHPSTGFVAVAMALSRFPRCRLMLRGFDSTMPQRANYWDARQDQEHATLAHNMLAEKRALAEIDDRQWLGFPIHARLDWTNRPDLGSEEQPEQVP